jgi:hypothetical protein
LNNERGTTNFEVFEMLNFAILFALQKTKLRILESKARTDCNIVCLAKNKTPVISRSFNHQSKNEQLIRLLFALNSFAKVQNFGKVA